MPTTLGSYSVIYTHDSSGHEKGRKFYNLAFTRKNADSAKAESFTLNPDVYLMKDNNMSSNPDTKSYLTRDVFTYISYALNQNAERDTTQFNVKELGVGDTMYYSNGYLLLNKVVRNPENERFHFHPDDLALMADVTVVTKDAKHYSAFPAITVDSLGIQHIDDTVFAQNIYVQFAGVGSEKKIKLGVKESDRLIDFVTIKAYVFPYINLVWLGLIVMAIGIALSMVKRTTFSSWQRAAVLLFVAVGLFYMFLLAN